MFRVEKDYGSLVDAASKCLQGQGWLLCCANTHRLNADDFQEMLQRAAGSRFKMETAPMSFDFPGSDYLKSVWMTQP